MTAAVRGLLRGAPSPRGLRVLVGLAAALIVGLGAVQLLDDEPRVTGASGVRPSSFVAELPARGGELCQPGVTLPPGSASIELLTGTFGAPGPRLTATLRDPATGAVVARTQVARGWAQGPLVIPLPASGPVREEGAGGTLCLRSAGGARLAVAGEPSIAPATIGGAPAAGRISVVANAAEPESVADLLPALADRIGRGNADWIGPWTVWAIGLLLLAAIALGGWAIVRTPASGDADPRPVPAPARALAGAALAVGLAWGLLTPPFQVPDETSHVAYVQYLSEAGKLPKERPEVPPYSDEEREVLGALFFAQVIGRPLEHVPSTPASEAYLRDVERRDLPLGAGNATTASANPPLYYLLQAPVYLAASGGSLLTQVMLMRLLSVLFMGASVLVAVLFLRELLPASPWAWTAGGLAAAFSPALGFVSAGVNPDSLLFLAGTVLLFGIARALRLGLTTRRACLVAGALAVGLLTKPLFFALVPVAGAGLMLAALRRRGDRLRPLAAAAAVAFVPVLLVAVVGAAAFDHPYFAVATAVAGTQADTTASGSNLAKQASFMWQLYLPRLPFLQDQLPGVPLRDIWINGFVGTFGWLDYGFGNEARVRGTRIFVLLLVLVGVALVRFRHALRTRWPLMLCCLLALACVPGAVGLVNYQAVQTGGARFEQARYLLPLLALYAGLFALAAKALGPRLGRVALPAMWAAVSLHTLAALILTANRYYI